MKRKLIFTILSIILILTMTATPAFAKDPEPDNEAQGKPFQELREAVAAIEGQLETITSDMEDMAAEIQAEVEGTLDALIEDLEDRIKAMVDEAVAELQAQINENESQLANLQDEISNIGWDDINNIPPGFADGTDDDTQLTEAQVDAFVANNGYLAGYTETDPLFTGSVAGGISSSDVSNWNTAYGWGDHSTMGYLTSVGWGDISDVPSDIADGDDDTHLSDTDIAAMGYLKSYTETDPLFTGSVAGGISSGDISNWNTAYGWGDHSTMGYLTGYTETEPLFTGSVAGGITATDIANWNAASGGGGDGHSLDAADGSPVDVVYVDDEGNVGIGTTSPSSLFEIKGKGLGKGKVDQQWETTPQTYMSHASDVWQSFTPNVSGALTRLDIRCQMSEYTMAGTLSIFEGQGTGGQRLAKQAVTYHGLINSIDLNTPVVVQAGSKYTWRLETAGASNLAYSPENPYPGGRANGGANNDYWFRAYVNFLVPDYLVITEFLNVGIGTDTPGGDKLDVRGRAYAEDGWQTTNADYAEWFEKEEDACPGDIIGINLETGKARKYRPGDRFIGVCSANPAYVGNRLDETDQEMARTHILVGLLGQMDFNEAQVVTEGAVVKTTDGVEIGILLSNGKIFVGR